MLREEIQKLVEHSVSPEEAAKLIVIYLEEEAGLGLDGNGWLEDDSWWQEMNEDAEHEDLENLRQKLEITLA